MKHHILLVEPMIREIEERLDLAYTVHRLFEPDGARAAEAAAGEIRAVVTGGASGLPRQWFDRLPRLGLIAVNGVGTDRVDLAAARQREICVTTTPGVLTDDVADMAMGLIIDALRRVTEGDRFVRDGAWSGGGEMPMGRSLWSLRLGILGLGQIGQALGRRAEAFGMAVGFWNRTPVSGIRWTRCGSPLELAGQSDVLAVCLAAVAETAGIVDAALLSALGPSGILVNVARGSLVDEEALVDALRAGRIAGAGLDVFATEPEGAERFRSLANVVMTPHQGSATVETRRAMGEIVLRNLDSFFAGEPLPGPPCHLPGA